MLTDLSLAGHDSELFSFLDPVYIEQLKKHPAAETSLWTFGDVDEEYRLRSVAVWNLPGGGHGGFAFTKEPQVERDLDSQSLRYRGFLTWDEIVRCTALTLVRHLFVQGYACALDERAWLQPADPRLDRLGYIRSWNGKSPDSPEWAGLQAKYFDWALVALDVVQKGPRR